MSVRQVCEGLTVLEFGRSMANAVATMPFAENGARVIKIEPPGGDPARATHPAAFMVWNRCKESIVLDLENEMERRQARRLAENADVLVEALSSGTAERFAIGYEALKDVNPSLVYCSIKGFGSHGPYAGLKAYDGIVSAKSGLYGPARFREGPRFSNFPQASHGAAHMAAQGVLAALLTREMTGRGQRVEATLYQGLNPYDISGMMGWHLAHRLGPSDRPAAGKVILPNVQLCTADGRWVDFTLLLPHQFAAFVRVLDLGAELNEGRFKTAPRFDEAGAAEAFRDVVLARFRRHELATWLPLLLAERDLPFEPILTDEEALEHPQVLHNRTWFDLHQPGIGMSRQVGPLAAFSRTPSQIDRPAPLPDQHGAMGSSISPRGLSDQSTRPAHPLNGLVVVELASFYAVPFAVALLASLGARVIKIEDVTGDPWRKSNPSGAVKTLEGKESIAVDLRTPEGRRILHALAAQADVFAYGLRASAARALGADHETLQALDPRLIYVLAGGYGSSGPYSERPMYGNTTTAMIGERYRQAGAWLDPGTAVRANGAELKEIARHLEGSLGTMGDPPAALGLATALLLALFYQRREGRGQLIETSMVNLNAHANADIFNHYPGKPDIPLPDAHGYGIHALYRLYRTAAGWLFLACLLEKEWDRLCVALGHREWRRDPRFATDADRKAHDSELAGALADVFLTRSAADWEASLVPTGVACVQVFEGSYAEFSCTDPVIRELGLVGEVTHPTLGTYLRHGVPAVLSETPGRLLPASELGQHTDVIMSELGYDATTIRSLKETGIIRSWR